MLAFLVVRCEVNRKSIAGIAPFDKSSLESCFKDTLSHVCRRYGVPWHTTCLVMPLCRSTTSSAGNGVQWASCLKVNVVLRAAFVGLCSVLCFVKLRNGLEDHNLVESEPTYIFDVSYSPHVLLCRTTAVSRRLVAPKVFSVQAHPLHCRGWTLEYRRFRHWIPCLSLNCDSSRLLLYHRSVLALEHFFSSVPALLYCVISFMLQPPCWCRGALKRAPKLASLRLENNDRDWWSASLAPSL